MHWSDVARNWQGFLPHILDHWPDLDELSLHNIAGNFEDFLSHLIDLHQGDQIAAHLELADWLRSHAPRLHHNETTRLVESGAGVAAGTAANTDTRSSNSKLRRS